MQAQPYFPQRIRALDKPESRHVLDAKMKPYAHRNSCQDQPDDQSITLGITKGRSIRITPSWVWPIVDNRMADQGAARYKSAADMDADSVRRYLSKGQSSL